MVPQQRNAIGALAKPDPTDHENDAGNLKRRQSLIQD
jgi:hypothetical protein